VVQAGFAQAICTAPLSAPLIRVRGPLPADTLFFLAGRGDYDMVVAMYHDQGHGPIKVLGLEAGVNITVGLPVIRTSVDHGTAFDIAGKGIADERSLIEALRQAADLAPKRSPPDDRMLTNVS
jgi:4-hydroxy-L-threonine phosphate dehydrogenase PdxA